MTRCCPCECPRPTAPLWTGRDVDGERSCGGRSICRLDHRHGRGEFPRPLREAWGRRHCGLRPVGGGGTTPPDQRTRIRSIRRRRPGDGLCGSRSAFVRAARGDGDGRRRCAGGDRRSRRAVDMPVQWRCSHRHRPLDHGKSSPRERSRRHDDDGGSAHDNDEACRDIASIDDDAGHRGARGVDRRWAVGRAGSCS